MFLGIIKSVAKKLDNIQTIRRYVHGLLLKDGFYMVQYSVYARVCNGQDAVKKHCQRVRTKIPSQGSVRVLTITEKQYQNIDIILGDGKEEDKPTETEILTIF